MLTLADIETKDAHFTYLSLTFNGTKDDNVSTIPKTGFRFRNM